jgi:hypothetical protein
MLKVSALVLVSVFASSVFASEGAEITGNPLAFASQRGEKVPNQQVVSNSEGSEITGNPLAFATQRRVRTLPKVTCAQAQDSVAYKGACGYPYVSIPAYVRTTDVKHCFIGYTCVTQGN